MTLLLTTLWLLFPAAIANMVPVLIARIPFLAVPIDGGLSWRGHRITGDHKTVRGFLFGTLAGALASYAEYLAHPLVADFIIIDYGVIPPLILGASLGFGALVGDSVKSFFKRQIGIPAGESWAPFDQLDWVVGALCALSFFIPVTLLMAVYAFSIGIPLHFFIRWLGGLILAALPRHTSV